MNFAPNSLLYGCRGWQPALAGAGGGEGPADRRRGGGGQLFVDMTLYTATPGGLGGGARAPHSPYHLHTPAALRGDTR